MVRYVFIISIVISVFQFVGCESIPLDVSEHQLITSNDISLPIDARVEIINLMYDDSDDSITNRSLSLRGNLDDNNAIKKAAKEVFSKVFREVDVRWEILDPHFTITIISESEADSFWGKYSVSVEVVILHNSGQKFGSYTAKEWDTSAFINDQTALENAYKKAFITIVEQIIDNSDSLDMLYSGVVENNLN